MFLGLLFCGAVFSACQPASRTPALPTRAYGNAPIESTAARALSEQTPPTATAAPSTPSAPSQTPSKPPTPSPAPTLPFTPTVTPTPAPQQVGELPSDGGSKLLIFPGPDDLLESWESLYEQSLLQDVDWADHSGQIDGSRPGSPTGITFRYPADWVVLKGATTRRITIQNAPADSGQSQRDFLKLDILHQPARPTISSEQTGDFQTHLVEIAGGPGLLIVYTQESGKTQVLSAIFKHDDAWYIAAGQINLLQADLEQLDRCRAVLFAMFQSIQITAQ